MSAGIPGLGLSGLFVLLSAAATPFLRVTRTRRNRVRPVRVRTILALAIVIAATTWVAWKALAIATQRVGGADRHVHTNFGSFFGIPIIVLSLALLSAIIFAAEVAARTLTTRPTPVNAPVRSARSAPADSKHAGNGRSVGPVLPDTAPLGQPGIESLCRELAYHRVQVRGARERAGNACERLIERFDADREDIRSLTTTIAAFLAETAASPR